MPPSGFRWAVQYWHGPSPQGPLPTFTSRDGPWANAPARNVIRVLLQRHGIRPHGNPDVLYTQTKEGPDHYYLIVASDAVRLGGWNDDGRPSHEVTWRADGRIFNVRRHAPPALDPAQLKHGVWVDEPWATRLGLSGGISRQEWQSASAREGALNDG